jgi:prophage regulatory protein
MEQPPLSGLLTANELVALTRLSRTSIYRMTRQGRFPPSYSLGNGHIRWREDEVRAWLAALPTQTFVTGKGAPRTGQPHSKRRPS